MKNSSENLDLVMFGIQGSGKGTQGKLIAEQGDYASFVMGDAFRALKTEQTPLAEEVRSYMGRGELVPQHIVMQVVREKIAAVSNNQPLIIDGIPRSYDQLLEFQDLMSELGRDFVGVNIDLSREEATRRIAGRAVQEGRLDDADPAVVNKRIQTFEEETIPVIEALRDQRSLIDVDGDGSLEEVNLRLITGIADFNAQIQNRAADLV